MWSGSTLRHRHTLFPPALKKEGLDELTAELAKPQPTGHRPDIFDAQVLQALEEIQKLLADKVPPQSLYWYAVKAFERGRS